MNPISWLARNYLIVGPILIVTIGYQIRADLFGDEHHAPATEQHHASAITEAHTNTQDSPIAVNEHTATNAQPSTQAASAEQTTQTASEPTNDPYKQLPIDQLARLIDAENYAAQSELDLRTSTPEAAAPEATTPETTSATQAAPSEATATNPQTQTADTPSPEQNQGENPSQAAPAIAQTEPTNTSKETTSKEATPGNTQSATDQSSPESATANAAPQDEKPSTEEAHSEAPQGETPQPAKTDSTNLTIAKASPPPIPAPKPSQAEATTTPATTPINSAQKRRLGRQLTHEARRLFWAGNFDGAIQRYEQLLDIQPNNWAAYGELGNIYYRIANSEGITLRHRQEAVALAVDAYEQAAILMYDNGLPMDAWQLANTINQIAPKRAWILAQRFDKNASAQQVPRHEHPEQRPNKPLNP